MDKLAEGLTLEMLPEGLYRMIAEAIGTDNFYKLAEVVGGTTVYIPRASPGPSATPASKRSSTATITRSSPGSTASQSDGFAGFAAQGRRRGRSTSSTISTTRGRRTTSSSRERQLLELLRI